MWQIERQPSIARDSSLLNPFNLPTSLLLEWNNGLTADLEVTSDHDGSGYTLVLTFDQEVTLEQWSGDGSSTDQK